MSAPNREDVWAAMICDPLPPYVGAITQRNTLRANARYVARQLRLEAAHYGACSIGDRLRALADQLDPLPTEKP